MLTVPYQPSYAFVPPPQRPSYQRPPMVPMGGSPMIGRIQPHYNQQLNNPAPPSYFNDPTLAPGFSGGGSYTSSPMPDGSTPVPFGSRIPLPMWKKGWRVRNVGGKFYFVPPGSDSQGAMPNYMPY